MNDFHAKLLREDIELLIGDELLNFFRGLTGDFFVLDGTAANINQSLLGKMGNQTRIRAVLDDRRRPRLRPLGNHPAQIHVTPVQRHLLRRGIDGMFVRIPQLDRGVDVKHAFFVTPRENF